MFLVHTDNNTNKILVFPACLKKRIVCLLTRLKLGIKAEKWLWFCGKRDDCHRP